MINQQCGGDQNNNARPSARAASRAHARVANRCAFIASILGSLLLGYYALVAAGELAEAPVGFVPVWSTTIIVLAAVKITHWAVGHEARRNRVEIAELRVAVEALADKVVEAKNQAWFAGYAQCARDLNNPGGGSVATFRPRPQRAGGN